MFWDCSDEHPAVTDEESQVSEESFSEGSETAFSLMESLGDLLVTLTLKERKPFSALLEVKEQQLKISMQ